jgi:hypothetical protein
LVKPPVIPLVLPGAKSKLPLPSDDLDGVGIFI